MGKQKVYMDDDDVKEITEFLWKKGATKKLISDATGRPPYQITKLVSRLEGRQEGLEVGVQIGREIGRQEGYGAGYQDCMHDIFQGNIVPMGALPEDDNEFLGLPDPYDADALDILVDADPDDLDDADYPY